jgi:Na+/H+ antiporter NhaA
MSTEKVSARTLTARVGRVVRRPLDRFLQLEAASSLLLIAAVVVALAWANSPWAASYDALWDTPVSLGLGSHAVDVSLHLVINDLLMAVFFFAAGLEIRRELTTGELCDRRRAALPVIAAVGGMVAPAAIYLVLDQGALARGWGIPMATDIAFAVGVLALLGNRVPSSMRVFLLALAIIDDLGSILVIAIFYSTGVQLDGLALAGVALGRFVLAKEASVPVEREPRRRFIPALERGPLSFVLLVFGVICAALELTAPDRIAGRALLFIIITIAGIVGVLRRKQTGAEPPLRE